MIKKTDYILFIRYKKKNEIYGVADKDGSVDRFIRYKDQWVRTWHAYLPSARQAVQNNVMPGCSFKGWKNKTYEVLTQQQVDDFFNELENTGWQYNLREDGWSNSFKVNSKNRVIIL